MSFSTTELTRQYFDIFADPAKWKSFVAKYNATHVQEPCTHLSEADLAIIFAFVRDHGFHVSSPVTDHVVVEFAWVGSSTAANVINQAWHAMIKRLSVRPTARLTIDAYGERMTIQLTGTMQSPS